MTPFPTSEYMLVLSPEAHLQERIMRIRQVLAECTGIRPNGRKAHIVLARWQAPDMQEERILQRLHTLSMEQYPFKVNLEGFKGFPSHTLYVPVPTREPILKLVASVRRHKRFMTEGETDPYFITEPHLSVARGLTPGQYEKAMETFSPKHFHAGFVADAMLLLKRKPGAQPYQILNRLDFEHLAITPRQATLFL
jgi:2'-5' RNA ligase